MVAYTAKINPQLMFIDICKHKNNLKLVVNVLCKYNALLKYIVNIVFTTKTNLDQTAEGSVKTKSSWKTKRGGSADIRSILQNG